MVGRFVRILVSNLDRGTEGDLVARQLVGINDLGWSSSSSVIRPSMKDCFSRAA